MPDEIFYRSLLNRDRLVHICDPDLATCEQLSLLFRLEGFQTMFSINLGGFLAALERRRPDVVVANFDLGADQGLDLLRRVKAMRMGTPVFMIENAPMVDAAVQAMKIGASDVVTRPIDTEHLVRIVREALRRDIHVGAVQAGGRLVEVRGFAQLTPREREVLQLMAEGRSNTAIAKALFIGVGAVEKNVTAIFGKLGLEDSGTDHRRVLAVVAWLQR